MSIMVLIGFALLFLYGSWDTRNPPSAFVTAPFATIVFAYAALNSTMR